MIAKSTIQMVDDFRYSFDIDCNHLEPSEWVPVLVKRIEKEGLMAREDGSCPQTKTMADFDAFTAFPPTNWSKEHCPVACANCTQACLQWLVPLGTLAGLYGAKAMNMVVHQTMA